MRIVRYVILHHHDIAAPHYDLLFEQEEQPALTTFRSPAWPISEPTRVEKLADHRRAYLDYEGPVSGGRGRVTRIESGQCQVFPYVRNQYSAKLLEPPPARLLIIEQSPYDYWVAAIHPAQ
jgi:hypothetical protein